MGLRYFPLVYGVPQLCFNYLIQAQTEIKFTNVTVPSGLDFQYTFGDLSYGNILESSGSGITVLDYNGDGLYDIYLLKALTLRVSAIPLAKYSRMHPISCFVIMVMARLPT